MKEKSKLYKVQLNLNLNLTLGGISPTLPPSSGGRQTTDYVMSLIEILTPLFILFEDGVITLRKFG